MHRLPTELLASVCHNCATTVSGLAGGKVGARIDTYVTAQGLQAHLAGNTVLAWLECAPSRCCRADTSGFTAAWPCSSVAVVRTRRARRPTRRASPFRRGGIFQRPSASTMLGYESATSASWSVSDATGGAKVATHDGSGSEIDARLLRCIVACQ